ncbi:ATP-dependent Clp protease proteolytic subunit 6 like [Actinidia chinensis var. chinensis]|uniref:ATP-dependent Clp protease proteolytic subunit n=1 Tax=Actinidia chinensis var. chinensis TaxID=1590841 RepID=A0A2R6RBV3_ACTCC|nr:ATP-dependent Clp protease proteolytic subunit 6 like [Actinidia chinensis var. chinensis]
MVASAISTPLSLSIASCNRASSLSSVSDRNSARSVVCAFPTPKDGSSIIGLSNKACGFPLKLEKQDFRGSTNPSYGAIKAAKGNPALMPAIMTPAGPLDLPTLLFRNRIIFIGQPIFSQVAQRVISQLVTLATIDEDADILVYLNCPDGSIYSVLAIYDCMSWIKPKVGTICLGIVASQAALLLAGGEKGMRYAMPNARIMIHQPSTGVGGNVELVKRQIKEGIHSRNKVDQMFVAFTGQPLENVQRYTERDRYMSPAEALDFGIIDGILETEI